MQTKPKAVIIDGLRSHHVVPMKEFWIKKSDYHKEIPISFDNSILFIENSRKRITRHTNV